MTSELINMTSGRRRRLLLTKFRPKLITNPELNRSLVSFQGNRKSPLYNWFKYKEGFSADMVTSLLEKIAPAQGVLLDPFAGSATALLAARSLGWNTIGIELLPVGLEIAEARLLAEEVDLFALMEEFRKIRKVKWENYYDEDFTFKHIAITSQAFPRQTERAMAGFLAYCQKEVSDEKVRRLMRFACMTILESISYTRKDGQYLRWDYRSGKGRTESQFDKGHILSFDSAIRAKLDNILQDIQMTQSANPLFALTPISKTSHVAPDLRSGSCLQILPQISSKSIDLILTSPPYCNRYDYTRTYALELVFLGYDDLRIKHLRQSMLSCTVENKSKVEFLRSIYKKADRSHSFEHIQETFEHQHALHEVLKILESYRADGRLNNPNIPSMVRNYFYEMCFVIHELSRVLRLRGKVIMVNDNVRYAGEEIPVDLILSSMAESFGLTTDHIWTLQKGKGNSSQQMGNHGRSELRKCVYVWEKSRNTLN